MLKMTATIAAFALMATSTSAYAAAGEEPQNNGSTPTQGTPSVAKPKVKAQGRLLPAAGALIAAGAGTAVAVSSDSP